MNKQQRKDWDDLIDSITKYKDETDEARLMVVVNTYILKLERELQNIKQGKKIAAILMPHGGPR